MRTHPQDVLKALSNVRDPNLQRDIVSLGLVKNIEVGEDRVSFVLGLPNPASPANEQLLRNAKEAVHALGVGDVQIQVEPKTAPAMRPGPNLIPQVRHTVAVASGKGGAGKSTVAANLAVALSRSGAKAGL